MTEYLVSLFAVAAVLCIFEVALFLVTGVGVS